MQWLFSWSNSKISELDQESSAYKKNFYHRQPIFWKNQRVKTQTIIEIVELYIIINLLYPPSDFSTDYITLHCAKGCFKK